MFGDVDVKYLETVLDPFEKADLAYIDAKNEYKKNNLNNAIEIMNILFKNLKGFKVENKHSGIFNYSFSSNYNKSTYTHLIKFIIDKNEFNESKIKNYRLTLSSYRNDYVLYFIIFFKKTDESIKLTDYYRKILKNNDALNNKDIRVLLFDDFVSEQFGEDNEEKVRSFTNWYQKEIRYKLCYHAMPVPYGDNYKKFLEILENDLLNMDYLSIKKYVAEKISKKYPGFKDLDMNSFNYILNNFKNRFKILLSEKDYSKSFITSAWLYNYYYQIDTMDNTFIISGFIKSIESFMSEYVIVSGATEDYEKFIKYYKLKDIKSLGIYELFLSNYHTDKKYFALGLLESTGETIKNYQNYFRTLIKTIREEYRNSNFHIESLEVSGIDEIRNLSIYTLMVLIGGLNIPIDSDIYKKLLSSN